MHVDFRLNGDPVEVETPADSFLVDLVRSLGATGTKEGCGVGVCGACTVLVDDMPVSSCIYLAGCVEGADVWTVEGLAERFPYVTEAFIEHEGFQCGICTPGQVAIATALRLQEPNANDEEIRDYLNGNLCRCTGYQTILNAVHQILEQ